MNIKEKEKELINNLGEHVDKVFELRQKINDIKKSKQPSMFELKANIEKYFKVRFEKKTYGKILSDDLLCKSFGLVATITIPDGYYLDSMQLQLIFDYVDTTYRPDKIIMNLKSFYI